tara:strand:+ start:607 stop:1428 length:822 start_codon:yes stop_codon:yes gene_type:complete
MKNIKVSVITLTKNNPDEFTNTAYSIFEQVLDFSVEWLIIDGSNKKNSKKNNELISRLDKKENTFINPNYLNARVQKIEGIYPSMNLGLKKANGKSILFLNSGDIFNEKFSLKYLYQEIEKLNCENSFVFGIAKIIFSKKIFWDFPGKRVSNIKNWLYFFEPNHQAMLISRKLAKSIIFDENCKVIADGIWKRKIIQKATSISFIRKTIINFNLHGISNKKPKFKNALTQIFNKEVHYWKKIIIIIKLISPNIFYRIYPYFQKYKSLFLDIIF